MVLIKVAARLVAADMNATNKSSINLFGSRRSLSISSVVLAIIILLDPAHLNYAVRAQRQSSEPRRDALEVEQRLAELGYWTGPVDGVFDGASRHALIAFQKVERRSLTGKLTSDELEAIRAAQRPSPLEAGNFHVEVDLSRQVLFIVETGGLVSKILPVSSGSGKPFTSEGWTRRAITPTGRFAARYKIAGWRRSPLGLLYYPVYILSGIAIHGNPSVPMYPASHGCIRVPMFAAKEFSQMIAIGTTVIVHGGGDIEP